MIRVLHFADLHLGVEAYGRTDPETGLSSRLGDFLAALDAVVEYAIAEGVDLVLFCGDAYRRRDPSQTHQREFARRIHRLARAGIPVVLVAGNHDLPQAPAQANAMEIFPTLAVAGVTVASAPAVHTIATRGGPVQVAALPWAHRSRLLAGDEFKNTPVDEVNRLLEERLTRILQERLFPQLEPELPAVLAGHFSVLGARWGSERAMELGRDYLLPPSAVSHPHLDYAALGHIHRQQRLETPTPIAYAGSLQPVDFSEEGEEKGFYIATLDPALEPGYRLAALDFYAVPYRSFVTIKVDASSDPSADPTPVVLRAIARHDIEGAIVRVQVSLLPGQRELFREREVRGALASAHWVASVVAEVQEERRTRLAAQAAETMSPLEALKLYLETKKTPLGRQEALLDYAERLIRGKIGSV